jgi:hypothetical protein
LTPSLRRGFSVLSACWLLFLLEPLSSTGLAFPFFLVVFNVTVFFGAVSLAFVLRDRPVNRSRILAWLIHPLAACALVALFLSSQSAVNPLFRLRFRLSRPALEEVARKALSQEPPATPTWVGLFPVRRIEVDESQVRFISDGCGVIDECSLAYMPGPIHHDRPKLRVQQIEGSWYHLYSVF